MLFSSGGGYACGRGKEKKAKRKPKPIVFPIYLIELHPDRKPLMLGGAPPGGGEHEYLALPMFTSRESTVALIQAMAKWGKVHAFNSARELLPWLEAVQRCQDVLWNPEPGPEGQPVFDAVTPMRTVTAQVRKQAAQEESAESN